MTNIFMELIRVRQETMLGIVLGVQVAPIFRGANTQSPNNVWLSSKYVVGLRRAGFWVRRSDLTCAQSQSPATLHVGCWGTAVRPWRSGARHRGRTVSRCGDAHVSRTWRRPAVDKDSAASRSHWLQNYCTQPVGTPLETAC